MMYVFTSSGEPANVRTLGITGKIEMPRTFPRAAHQMCGNVPVKYHLIVHFGALLGKAV